MNLQGYLQQDREDTEDPCLLCIFWHGSFLYAQLVRQAGPKGKSVVERHAEDLCWLLSHRVAFGSALAACRRTDLRGRRSARLRDRALTLFFLKQGTEDAMLLCLSGLSRKVDPKGKVVEGRKARQATCLFVFSRPVQAGEQQGQHLDREDRGQRRFRLAEGWPMDAH